MIDRKESGENKDSLIFLPCNYLLNTQKLVGKKCTLLGFCSYQNPGVLEDSACLKPHMPVIIQEHLPFAASLISQNCHHSTIKTLGLLLAPSYAGIKLQLVPRDFNSSFRASRNISFFLFPLFGPRVKEWGGIIQASMFWRHSMKQNSLHQDVRCVRAQHTRTLLVTWYCFTGVARKEVRKGSNKNDLGLSNKKFELFPVDQYL